MYLTARCYRFSSLAFLIGSAFLIGVLQYSLACSGPGETNDKVRIWANDYSRLKGLYSNSFLKSQNIEIMKDKPGTSRTIYVKTKYRRADNSFAEKETTAIAFYASRLYRFVDTVLTHCSWIENWINCEPERLRWKFSLNMYAYYIFIILN